MIDITELLGKTLIDISVNTSNDVILFTTSEGITYIMHHQQDCCECVDIHEIVGDLNDLVNSPILQAEESTNSEDAFGRIRNPDSFTWTFYKLATIKGYVTISWLGESNGYYSESVDFEIRQPHHV